MVALALSGCKEKRNEVGAAAPEKPLVDLPGAPLLSPAGYQLILDFEVGGGKPYYDKKLARPTWPGEASGVTVGVGYDCGYNSKAVILSDWERLKGRERLAATAGITGTKAKALIPTLQDILVEWGLAEEVFNRVTLTRFYELTRRTYPGFDRLHRNAQAALVSLTFNRGSGMTGDRRKEMRMIRECAAKQDYAGMAYWNRQSIRVWKGTSIEEGMRRRREAEARLMETPI